MAGIVGIVMTIMFSKDQAKKEREILIERDREERRLSIAPLFLVATDSRNRLMFDSKFIFNLNGKKSNAPCDVMLEITNVGLGNAVDFELKFVSYGDRELRQALTTELIKIYSPLRVMINLSIYLPELPDDIDEHLHKNPKEYLIPYSVPKNIVTREDLMWKLK